MLHHLWSLAASFFVCKASWVRVPVFFCCCWNIFCSHLPHSDYVKRHICFCLLCRSCQLCFAVHFLSLATSQPLCSQRGDGQNLHWANYCPVLGTQPAVQPRTWRIVQSWEMSPIPSSGQKKLPVQWVSVLADTRIFWSNFLDWLFPVPVMKSKKINSYKNYSGPFRWLSVGSAQRLSKAEMY